MIYLFNKEEELTKVIPSKGLISPIQTEILNGLMTLDVEMAEDYYKDVKDAEFIGHKDYEDKNIFHLYKINNIGVSNRNLTVAGLHVVFDELKGYGYIKDRRLNNVTATAALETILTGSRWAVGQVGVNSQGSTNFYDITRLDALSKLIDVWRCEVGYRMIFDGQKIVGRFVDLYNQRGTDTGKRFVYGSNALTIEYEENRNEIYTAIVGRGRGEEKFDEEGNPTGGFGRKITFEDVEWSKSKGDPVNKPLGQDYVEISEMTALYGYSDGSPRLKIVDYSDIEDPEQLLRAAYVDAINTSRPKVQFKTNVEKIGNVHLGDSSRIIRHDLGFYYSARIFEVQRNLLNNNQTQVKLGDYIDRSQARKNREINNELKNISDALSDVAVNTDTKNQSLISQVQEFLAKGLFNEDGYNYDLKAGNEYNLPAGYYSFNAPIEENPTKVIYVGAGTMAISNKKDSNGDWIWTTFATGDGLVADAIVTGMLKGGKVEFDLTNGTLLIGNSVSDYQLLWDGNSLKINGKVHIGSNSTFDSGYDPSTKETPDGAQTKADSALSDAKDYTDSLEGSLGDMAYEDLVQLAKLGETIIEGGYIKTDLLQVDNLSAIAAKIAGYIIVGDILQGEDIELSPRVIRIGRDTLGPARQAIIMADGTFKDVSTGAGSHGTAGALHLDVNRFEVLSRASIISGLKIVNNNNSISIALNDLMPTGSSSKLGSHGLRWREVYLQNQPNVSSDARQKSLIQQVPDDLLAELKEIKPKMYMQNDKWHFGYIAQDVERALYKYAVKTVGFENAREYMEKYAVLHKSESYLSLLYGEIAVLKDAETQRKIDDLENRVASLESLVKEMINNGL